MLGEEGKSDKETSAVSTASSQMSRPQQTANNSTQPSQPTQNTANVVVRDDERKQTETDTLLERMLSQMQMMQARMEATEQQQQQWQQRQQQQWQQWQQHQVAEGTGGRSGGHTADTLPTPVSAFRHARFAARAPQPHRISFGMPAVAESPSTPARRERVEEAAAAAAAPARRSGEENDRSALKEALSMAHKRVESFYADSVKDKDNYSTVTSFVEKIETVMGDCYLPYHLRLTMVRWFLQEGALRWMNKKLAEMEGAANREGRDLVQQPFDWDSDVRSAFIQAHMGTDTVELWLAKLAVLELDEKKKGAAKNPIELESQFDNIARHVYPYHVADDDRSELLLSSKYSEIISRCQPELYSQIVYSTRRLTTLGEWKEALVRVWTARERILAATSIVAQQVQPKGSQGGWRGRSGTSDAKQHSVSVLGTDDNARKEGQQYPKEEPSGTEQLTAFNSNRGGRGGRGGGGGGGDRGGTPFSPERQRLYDEQRCFRCKEVGHKQQHCNKPPIPQQSKGRAGQ